MTQSQSNITQKTLPSFKKVFGFTVLAIACTSMAGCFGSSQSKKSSRRSASSTEATIFTATTPTFDSAALTTLQERGWAAYSNLKFCQADDEDLDACTASSAAASTGFYIPPRSETYYKNYIANVARPSLGYELDPTAQYSSLSEATKNAIVEKVIRYCSGGNWGGEGSSQSTPGFVHFSVGDSDSYRWDPYETDSPSLSTLNVRDAIINMINGELFDYYCSFVDVD